MVDMNTFLTTLYVMVDDFCNSQYPVEVKPGRGRRPSLTRSEVVTLSLVSQWYRFRSQRDFYRFAASNLRAAFPSLPTQPQYNRLVRRHRDSIVAFFLHLVDIMDARQVAYEILDTTGVPVRSNNRRGRGWFLDANRGLCTRLGWYYGFRLLISTTPLGIITGFGFGPGSAKEQPMTTVMLDQRHKANQEIPSVGRPALGSYLADAGFAGRRLHARWRQSYGVDFIAPPQTNSRIVWPKAMRRWLHSHRQIVETVFGKLMDFHRLDRDRPHELDGFWATLASKIALHNFCIWFNTKLGRQPLRFADLLGW